MFSESFLDNFLRKIQNEDGSYGHKKRVQVTSLAIIDFVLEEGPLFHQADKEMVIKSLKFLEQSTKSILRDKKVKDAALCLWAFSETYADTGFRVRESSQKLWAILQNYIESKEKIDSHETAFVISRAYAAYCRSGFIKQNKAPMELLCRKIVEDLDLSLVTLTLIETHLCMWDMKPIRGVQFKLPQKLSKLMHDLDSSSPRTRKKAFAETSQLNDYESYVLKTALLYSKSFELQQVAKDISTNFDHLGVKSKDNTFMYWMSLYFLMTNKQNYRTWQDGLDLRHHTLFKNYDSDKDKDESVIQSMYARLAVAVYNQHSPSVMEWRKMAPDIAEKQEP